MGWILNSLLLPTIGAVASGVVVFIIQKYFLVWGSISFLGYPRINGSYRAVYPDGTFPPERVKINQLGSRITGTIFDPGSNREYNLVGNVTRTRLIVYEWRPVDPTVNNYGTALLKLSRSGDIASGHLLYVSEGEEEPSSIPLQFEKT